MIKIHRLPISYDPKNKICAAFVIYNNYFYSKTGTGTYKQVTIFFTIRNQNEKNS